MTPQRVTMITLGVKDLAASRAFYKALGWVESSRSQETIAFFQLEGAVLGLYSLEDLAKEWPLNGAPQGVGAMTLAQNFETQADVDEAFANALACGATPLKQPEPVFWGGYSGYYADPDGHVWEALYNPNWLPNDDGSASLLE